MSILLKADSLVNGDRQCDYDEPVGSFNVVAKLVSLMTKKEFTAKDCCMVLIAVKLARESFKHKEDNLVDLCGYTELLNRIENANKS